VQACYEFMVSIAYNTVNTVNFINKYFVQGLNKNLLLMSFIIVMSTSYQFGYNIGVLNQPVAVSVGSPDCVVYLWHCQFYDLMFVMFFVVFMMSSTVVRAGVCVCVSMWTVTK